MIIVLTFYAVIAQSFTCAVAGFVVTMRSWQYNFVNAQILFALQHCSQCTR